MKQQRVIVPDQEVVELQLILRHVHANAINVLRKLFHRLLRSHRTSQPGFLMLDSRSKGLSYTHPPLLALSRANRDFKRLGVLLELADRANVWLAVQGL